MQNAYRIVWSEGLFLTPHHFQQATRYFESVPQQHINCLLPFTWGVYEISIDEDAIKNGLFSLDKFKGIMPDGTPLDAGGNDPVPGSRSFKNLFTPAIDSLDVFLTIPLYKRDKIVCNLDEGKADSTPARYKKEDVKVLDENTASNEQILPAAKKNIKIIFSGESLEDFSAIKIATINRLSDNFYLDENYIPGLLSISASKPLMKMLRRTLENVSSRSTELSNMRRQRTAEMADFTPSDISNFLFLQTINSSIPLLNHFYHTGTVHPEQLYKCLVQLMGELMTFSTEGHPRDLPAYNHSDLTKTFTEIDEKLQQLLGTVISARNVVYIPLEAKTENTYTGSISDSALFAAGKFFLAVEGGEIPQTDIIQYVPVKLKLSSADVISALLNSAMPGIGLRHVAIPPSYLPIKVGYEYFAIEPSGELWTRVKDTGSIAIYVPKDLKAIKLKLLVIKS